MSFTLLFTGCNQEVITPENEVNSSNSGRVEEIEDTDGKVKMPKVKDGRLAFKDEDHVREVLTFLRAKKLKQVMRWNERKGFESLYTKNYRENQEAVNQMKAQATDLDAEFLDKIVADGRDKLVKDDKLASILNTNYEWQFGNKIYRYTDKFYFIYKKGKADVVQKFMTDWQTGKITKKQLKKRLKYDADLEVGEIIRISSDDKITENANSGRVERTVDHIKFKKDRRLVAAHNYEQNGLTARVYAETYYQHRSFGIWWAAKADDLVVSIEVV